jgi:hypothetical protein
MDYSRLFVAQKSVRTWESVSQEAALIVVPVASFTALLFAVVSSSFNSRFGKP